MKRELNLDMDKSPRLGEDFSLGKDKTLREFILIAIPGLPLLYSDPDMCPWMLVVVYYLVYILSYFVFEL